jgi:hypothetical protein
MNNLESYRALALQVTCHAVNQTSDRQQARSLMQNSINRLGQQIAASIAFIGFDCRLIVLPEYFLTGFPMGDSLGGWAEKACIEMAGAEYEALGKIAQKHQIFLAGNAYEVDPNFPGLYFQTCFILDPSGSIVLRYRRLNSLFAPTPHIDLGALRRDRRRPGLNNLLARQRFELYAESYSQSHFYPANTMLEGEVDRKHFLQTQQATIERLAKLGII